MPPGHKSLRCGVKRVHECSQMRGSVKPQSVLTECSCYISFPCGERLPDAGHRLHCVERREPLQGVSDDVGG